MDISITELESYFNLNQILIDKLVRETNINNFQDKEIQKKLNFLNKQKEMIINEIENKLNERFS